MQVQQNLNEILNYIQEREKTLVHYSNKLRQSVVKIADVFGNPQYCQRCNKWALFHEGKWRDKPEGKDVCGNFKPKIQVSIDVVDDQSFAEEKDEISDTKYYLAILERNMGFVCTFTNDKYMPKNLRYFDSAPRKLLKALVKSGRLIPFLQKVADTIQVESEKYKEVAEIAEKMAQAIDTAKG
jgi:hypothetical protein